MLKWLVICVAAVSLALAGAVAYPGTKPPAVLTSIGAPFKDVDWSTLPAVSMLPRAQGAPLGYRSYAASGNVAVIGVHGSSGTSTSLHPVGAALQRAGVAFYAIDVRGHGASAPKGTVSYRGQLDDDLRAMVVAVRKEKPNVRIGLLGFSSGAGYTLHAASTEIGELFDFDLFLAPFLGQVDGVQRPANGWAVPNIPRIIALSVLSRFGIAAFDNLPVLAFAINPKDSDVLTGVYSFGLLREFRSADYASELKRIRKPVAVLVGAEDQLFFAEGLAKAVQAARPDIAVEVLPGLDHVRLTTDAKGLAAIVLAVERLATQK